MGVGPGSSVLCSTKSLTQKMKFLVAFSCLLATTLAKPSLAPAAVSYAAPAPVAYAAPAPLHLAPRSFSYSVTSYAAPAPAPLALAAPAPVAYAAPAPAPVAYAAPAPAAVAVPAPVVKSQYHAQDELGQASYGHAEPYQAHNAVQDAAGNKVGSYSYVAPNGQVISANYVADALGYRVTSNVLPAAPVAVGETPEVSAARAAHLAEHAAAKSRSRRSVAAVAYAAPAVAYHAPAVAYAAPAVAYAAPAAPAVAYAAPAAPLLRAAQLTTIVNNPGHAVSYRVD